MIDFLKQGYNQFIVNTTNAMLFTSKHVPNRAIRNSNIERSGRLSPFL